ncbi:MULTISPECIES: PDR/VanB family oxidoreductase [unclassified Amycolatopsis]|uniref:PDR/VanB family oxidoreductase n=1 Tax=unclassified Amycolatopsis TaxID=2618356 RepID=UPI001C6A422E|nr:PDR/VanB family oxidoreductase [Amycolatopsis sp. DSM 110486]QYN20216.1 PDR/VanB family oxidoreductase [Amycolatopsis sp. DSM 110486]
MPPRQTASWHRVKVRESFAVADQIRRIVLDPPAGPAPQPGSHVDVLVPAAGGGHLVRSYSVVDDGRFAALSLGVRLDPHSRGGSAFMHRLCPGDEVTITAPIQTFGLTPRQSRYVLLAGGIGITPMIGMARKLKADKTDYEIFYAGRNRVDMAFVEELREDHGERVRVRYEDEDGRFDLLEVFGGLTPETELYVCGPVGMLEAAQKAWEATGHPSHLLRFETFGSSGRLPNETFEVVVPKLGLTVTVPPDKSALDALGEAGCEVMSDCLRGECGLCVLPVRVADGVLDHRDVFLSGRQKAQGDQMCLCVSRLSGGSLVLDLP